MPSTVPVAAHKNLDIEALRAVAIIFTFVVHFQTLPIYPASAFSWIHRYMELSIGVDLFLVVSGFVITKSLLSSQAGGSSTKAVLFAFWVRRVFRLLPAAWFWLLLVAGYKIGGSIAADGGATVAKESLAILAAFFNVMNFYLMVCWSAAAPDICVPQPAHGHYWSLSLEEQFYLVFPLVLLLVSRRQVILVAAALIAILFFWQRPLFSFGFFIRVDGLCWGVLLAFMSTSKMHDSLALFFSRRIWLLRLLMLMAIAALPLVARQVLGLGNQGEPYGTGVVSLLAALIVAGASFDLPCLSINGLIRRTIVYLGSRSYSLYIVHMLAFFVLRELLVWQDWDTAQANPTLMAAVICALAMTLTFLLSELTYRYIEVSWRARGRRVSERMLARSDVSVAKAAAALAGKA